jgi:DNA-binding NarL/FixJ family response regulator
MPGRDGIETLLEINSARPQVKVLAVSGGGTYVPDSFVELTDKLGADATLRKPVNIDRLCSVVKKLAGA